MRVFLSSTDMIIRGIPQCRQSSQISVCTAISLLLLKQIPNSRLRIWLLGFS